MTTFAYKITLNDSEAIMLVALDLIINTAKKNLMKVQSLHFGLISIQHQMFWKNYTKTQFKQIVTTSLKKIN